MEQFQATQDAINGKISDLENITELMLREFKKAADSYQALLRNRGSETDQSLIDKYSEHLYSAKSLLHKLETQINNEEGSPLMGGHIIYDPTSPGRRYDSLVISQFPKREASSSLTNSLLERYFVLLAIFNPVKEYTFAPPRKKLPEIRGQSPPNSEDRMEKAKVAIENRLFSYFEIASSVGSVMFYAKNNIGLALTLAEHARKKFPAPYVHIEPREQMPIVSDEGGK